MEFLSPDFQGCLKRLLVTKSLLQGLCYIKPLYANEFFHLVGHNEPRRANCTYQGVTCWNFQIDVIQSLKIVLKSYVH